MFNEHAYRVDVHRFDWPHTPLIHHATIRAATQPRFEVAVVGQANPAGRHVVHAVGLPGLAAQPEPAVARLDERRLRLGCPHAQLMAQRVNRRRGQAHTDRDARVPGFSGKAILFDRLRLARMTSRALNEFSTIAYVIAVTPCSSGPSTFAPAASALSTSFAWPPLAASNRLRWTLLTAFFPAGWGGAAAAGNARAAHRTLRASLLSDMKTLPFALKAYTRRCKPVTGSTPTSGAFSASVSTRGPPVRKAKGHRRGGPRPRA